MKAHRPVILTCFLAPAFWCAVASPVRADTLTITSNPPGAKVEINGSVVGTTPYQTKMPGGYFHKTHSVFGARLEHRVVARIFKEGYLPQEVTLTEGPFEWVSALGNKHGEYWLLKSDHFEVELEKAPETFTGTVQATANAAPIELKPELPAERIVQLAAPAVVRLEASAWSGTGFFVTETGVIATNRHVAEGTTNLFALTSEGLRRQARVLYADSALDLALVKVDGEGFPHLRLADNSSIHAGQSVMAIGNPGYGMPNTVTKGVVSAVGSKKELGTGTWIQTDAAINAGNSGGPLLNARGEAVGINTLTVVAPGVQGIHYALSSGDLLRILSRFYKETSAPATRSETDVQGRVAVTSEPGGADVFVDGKFVGQTPAKLTLTAGAHHIEVQMSGRQTWQRDLNLLKESDVSLSAVLPPQN